MSKVDLDALREAGYFESDVALVNAAAAELALARAVVEAAGKHVELSSDHEPHFGPCSCFLCAALAAYRAKIGGTGK